MEISPARPLLPGTPRPTAQEADPTSPAATADFDSFLNLLTAQLRFQDPLQPLDSTQFVAQLASFSTVEQLIGSNDRLDALLDRSEAGSVEAYAAWIGREASRPDGRAMADGGPIAFDLQARPEALASTAQVIAADGTVLREIPVPAGITSLAWDGMGADGSPVPDQPVTVIVEHRGPDGPLGREPAQVWERVTGLAGGEEGPELLLADGSRIAPGAISGLREPPPGGEG